MEDNEKEYIVYMHRCRENKKVYIGQTCKDIKVRWGNNGKKYLNKHKNGSYVHPHFARAIIKYGWDNFDHIVLFEHLDKDSADRIEQLCIFMFKANNPDYGYNCSAGGAGGFNGGKHSEESKRKIGKSSKGRRHTKETKEKLRKMKIGHKNTPTQPVLCIEQHKIWSSMKDAYTELNVDRSCLDDVCTGRLHTLLGCHWIYVNNFSMEHVKEILMRPDSLKFSPVVCVEKDELYISASEASRKTGVDCSSLLRCVKGENKTAGGYHWKDGTEEWTMWRDKWANKVIDDILLDKDLMNQINKYQQNNFKNFEEREMNNE